MNNRLPFSPTRWHRAVAPAASKTAVTPHWSGLPYAPRAYPTGLYPVPSSAYCRAAISFTASPTVVLCHDFHGGYSAFRNQHFADSQAVGAPVCSISSTVNAPFREKRLPFQPSASVSHHGGAAARFSVGVVQLQIKLVRSNPGYPSASNSSGGYPSTVVISLPSILMLNAGVLLPFVKQFRLKFTTAALPPFY